MALFACKVGGSEGTIYSYTFPFTISLKCNHTASAPQSTDASVDIPLIGALLKDVQTITVTQTTGGSYEKNCILRDSDGNTVITLNTGDNDMSACTEATWNSIKSLFMSGGHYTSAGRPSQVTSVTFKIS